MSTENEPGQEQGQGAGAEDETPSTSVLGNLRALRRKKIEHKVLDLDVPGYEGYLVARYTTVPFKVLEENEKKVKKDKSGSKMLLLAMDQMISCCEQILVRDAGSPDCLPDLETGEPSEYRPISVEAYKSGSPVKWDNRLADILEIPEDEHKKIARLVIKAVFGQEVEITDHSSRIGIWLKDTSKDVDEGFLGES